MMRKANSFKISSSFETWKVLEKNYEDTFSRENSEALGDTSKHFPKTFSKTS